MLDAGFLSETFEPLALFEDLVRISHQSAGSRGQEGSMGDEGQLHILTVENHNPSRDSTDSQF